MLLMEGWSERCQETVKGLYQTHSGMKPLIFVTVKHAWNLMWITMVIARSVLGEDCRCRKKVSQKADKEGRNKRLALKSRSVCPPTHFFFFWLHMWPRCGVPIQSQAHPDTTPIVSDHWQHSPRTLEKVASSTFLNSYSFHKKKMLPKCLNEFQLNNGWCKSMFIRHNFPAQPFHIPYGRC